MNRKYFIQTLSMLSLTKCFSSMKILNELSKLEATQKMPVLFLGHGSPMNAIEDNEFVKGFKTIATTLPTPKAILCISAHWETKGTKVTAMEKPKTIHDFGGFPKELYEVQYPANGSPFFATETQKLITSTNVELDTQWGLDHGCWSVVKHLYPNADVPVFQMSLNYTQTPQQHYDLARELQSLRDKGVLIIGSGNMVHNLGMIAWDKMKEDNYSYDWAKEANDKIKYFILNKQHNELINFSKLGKSFELAIPTVDHYLPLLYTLALQGNNENVNFFNDKAVAGSLTMTSLKIG